MTLTYEHPSISPIRGALHQYRLRSPAHFDLRLEVHQDTSRSFLNEENEGSARSVDLVLSGCSEGGLVNIQCTCHVVFHPNYSCYDGGSWECTGIGQDQSTIVLENFLGLNFPVTEGLVQSNTMEQWWRDNGKTFRWTGLPTELKERIIEFCMHHPHEYGDYTKAVIDYKRRYRPNLASSTVGPFEVVDQLGDWYHLLYVSHQVRAITLRLCTTGSSSLNHSSGLCILASSYRQFADSINRLGDYYQMSGPDSIPTTTQEEALSKCYRRFPRIYPHLHQYATFRHGIQKVSLSMDFLSYMNFFEVKNGGFERYQDLRRLTYHVFERLPALNEIVIRLPLRPRKGWRHRPGYGLPQLFHDDAPCPRSLHRTIYERVAEVLASYNVRVVNFIDEDEEHKFHAARLSAIKALKFSMKDLEELYADDGGGVELPDDLERAKEFPKSRPGVKEVEQHEDFQDQYFPPKCRCVEPCALSIVLRASGHH